MLRLPIGISEFTELRKGNYLYIDKTKYAHSLITQNTRSFLSRPRRFGKSLFVSTLEAILQGEKELFDGLWIETSGYPWDPVGVIRLDFSLLNVQSIQKLSMSLANLLVDIAENYSIKLDKELDVNTTLRRLIAKLREKFSSVAILIDEYDYPILHTLHNPELSLRVQEVMENFSCVIKACAKDVQFVFVTGMSVFSKIGLSSGLNNLINLTMDRNYAEVCGYTKEEVDSYFKDYIRAWAEESRIPYSKLREQLKDWYSGYSFSKQGRSVYSPFSMVCAIHTREIQNFWQDSGLPQFLLSELSKEERKEECYRLQSSAVQKNLNTWQACDLANIPLVALFFQMGYLTIDSYEAETNIYRLTSPNLEAETLLETVKSLSIN